MKKQIISLALITIGITAMNVAQYVFHVPEWIIWTILFGLLMLAIVDYYWLGGKLNAEGRHYGKK